MSVIGQSTRSCTERKHGALESTGHVGRDSVDGREQCLVLAVVPAPVPKHVVLVARKSLRPRQLAVKQIGRIRRPVDTVQVEGLENLADLVAMLLAGLQQPADPLPARRAASPIVASQAQAFELERVGVKKPVIACFPVESRRNRVREHPRNPDDIGVRKRVSNCAVAASQYIFT